MEIKYCKNGVDCIIDTNVEEEGSELYSYLLAVEDFQTEIWNDPEAEEPLYPNALKALENEEIWYNNMFREIYYPEHPEKLKTFYFWYKNEGYDGGMHWVASTNPGIYDHLLDGGDLYE